MATRTRSSNRFVVNLDGGFSRGMIRDVPRNVIPPGGVYDSTDFLLHEPGVAIKRGGTSYAGPAMTGGTYGQSVIYAPFPGGSQLLAASQLGHGHIYKITSGTTTDLGGTAAATKDTPKLWIGGGKNLVVWPNYDGTTAPTKYDGSAAPSLLGGTPPAGRYCAVYKSRLALGGNSANPNRLFFSPIPDIESTWDTTNSWIDCDNQIRGLAALRNALLVFSLDHTEVITGSTPPGQALADMDRYPLGSIGCTDARSIVVQEGSVIFANPRGVYITTGSGFDSLTGPPRGGIETYWQGLLASYDPDTWTIAGGLYRRFYVVTIINNSGTIVDVLMCNLPSASWWRLTNIGAMMWSSAFGSQEELYYADRTENRVIAVSGMFTPSRLNNTDAVGAVVAPTLTTRSFGQGPTQKHFGFAHLTYAMPGQFSAPTLTTNVYTGIAANTATAAPESPLAETTDLTAPQRARLTVGKVNQCFALKFTHSSSEASDKTELYSIEYEERPLAPQEGGP